MRWLLITEEPDPKYQKQEKMQCYGYGAKESKGVGIDQDMGIVCPNVENCWNISTFQSVEIFNYFHSLYKVLTTLLWFSSLVT